MFRVGQKVVCIDEGWHDSLTLEPSGGPIKGSILVIDGIKMGYLSFNEFQDLDVDGDRDYYTSEAFRPIDYSFGESVAAEIEESINEIIEVV